MASDAFSRLGPTDFEELCCDLLSAAWSIPLEIFAQGRDGGIDLRHIGDDDERVIVQCKHYAKSGFGRLRSSLRANELPKLVELRPRPERYVLATSVDLTPANKATLADDLSPYLREQDALGASDLAALLRAHPEVERRHFKLWLHSSGVLASLIDSDIIGRSDELKDRVERRAPMYVRPAAHVRVNEILTDSNACIISGPPGVGKTSLAEMVVLEHLERGYQVVAVSDDITEAYRLRNPGKQQLFYYDDFLGRSFLADTWSKNEESRLTNFIGAVRDSEADRIVLTTREYILRDATNRRERVSSMLRGLEPLVLEMGSYTRMAKARILLNHLYFFNIDPSDLDLVHDSSLLLEIIDHPSYNPRLVETVLAGFRSTGTSALGRSVLASLRDPTLLWADVWRTDISPRQRLLCCTLLSFDRGTARDDSLHRACAAIIGRGPYYDWTDFKSDLHKLDDTLFRTTFDNASRKIIVRFYNPAAEEFVAQELGNDKQTTLLLCTNLVDVAQVRHLLSVVSSDVSRSPGFSSFQSALVEGMDSLWSRTIAEIDKGRLFGASTGSLPANDHYEDLRLVIRALTKSKSDTGRRCLRSALTRLASSEHSQKAISRRMIYNCGPLEHAAELLGPESPEIATMVNATVDLLLSQFRQTLEPVAIKAGREWERLRPGTLKDLESVFLSTLVDIHDNRYQFDSSGKWPPAVLNLFDSAMSIGVEHWREVTELWTLVEPIVEHEYEGHEPDYEDDGRRHSDPAPERMTSDEAIVQMFRDLL